MKAFLAAVGLCVSLVVSAGSPALAAEPQENPDNAAAVYDGVSLLQKYSQVLDGVLAGDAAGLQQLQIQAASANFPPELGTAAGSFFSAGVSLVSLLPSLRQDLDDANTLLEQYRIDDAEQILANAQQRLREAYSNLLAMNISAVDTGNWWKADLAPDGSTLRQANDEVLDKLRRLRQLLDLLDNMNLSLTRQTEAILAITEGDLAKVEELKGILAQEKASPEALARLDELKGLLLRPTTLTLSIEPGTAFVGDKITFRGTFGSEGKPLSGRIVTVLLDNAPVSSVLTNNDGSYQGNILLPYRYVPEMKVRALFYPVGNDIGRYLGTSSDTAVLNVLFYRAALNAEQGTPANPGRDFLVTAAFKYDSDAPPLEERRLIVYLDNELILETTVSPAFFLRLSVPADTAPGMHRLTMYAAPHGRYAPAQSRLELEVTTIVPVIEVNTPGLILLPFIQDIRGKVSSSLGPLKNITVEITLGGWAANTTTQDDGTFLAHLTTGMSLTWLGSQDLRIAVAPKEPWYRSASATIRVLVVNPANIAGIIIVLLVLAVSGTRRLGRKASLPAGFREQPGVEPGPILITKADVPALQVAVLPGDPRYVLLSLYRGVLRFVQQITGMVLPPYQTLREFAAENEPGLGRIGRYFHEFTLMIERLLYSRHDFDERDVAHARELSGKVMKGTGDEDS